MQLASDAKTYTITVNAKIGSSVKQTTTFDLVVTLNCENTLTLDESKFLTLPYTVGDTAASRTWYLTDLTSEPLCGDVTWTATKTDDLVLWSFLSVQVDTSPYSVSVQTNEMNHVNDYPVKVTASYSDHPSIKVEKTFIVSIASGCDAATVSISTIPDF